MEIVINKENLNELSEEAIEKLRNGELDLCIGYDDEEAFNEIEGRSKRLGDFSDYPSEIKEALKKIFKKA